MVDEYIRKLCELLNIPVPSVSYNTSGFSTSTMMAQCNSRTNTIYLREIEKPDPDYMFSIAHELRHLWQLKTDEQLYFSTYKTVDKIGVDDYNLQIAELDANAFGMIIMRDFFHLQAKFDGINQFVKAEIEKRASIIESSL